jgi:hypothetical protein
MFNRQKYDEKTGNIGRRAGVQRELLFGHYMLGGKYRGEKSR